jgi:hypothetical protein
LSARGEQFLDDHFLYASDVPHLDREFPKNLKYLWNHPDLSQKEKIAYHNGKQYFQLDRPASALDGKRAEITKIVES